MTSLSHFDIREGILWLTLYISFVGMSSAFSYCVTCPNNFRLGSVAVSHCLRSCIITLNSCCLISLEVLRSTLNISSLRVIKITLNSCCLIILEVQGSALNISSLRLRNIILKDF